MSSIRGATSGVIPRRLNVALAAAASAAVAAATREASATTAGATATAAKPSARRTARASFLHRRATMSRRRRCVGRIAKADGLKVTVWLDLNNTLRRNVLIL